MIEGLDKIRLLRIVALLSRAECGDANLNRQVFLALGGYFERVLANKQAQTCALEPRWSDGAATPVFMTFSQSLDTITAELDRRKIPWSIKVSVNQDDDSKRFYLGSAFDQEMALHRRCSGKTPALALCGALCRMLAASAPEELPQADHDQSVKVE